MTEWAVTTPTHSKFARSVMNLNYQWKKSAVIYIQNIRSGIVEAGQRIRLLYTMVELAFLLLDCKF
jgi:hypothetical protein